MPDRVYCYPGTDILMNKLNIHDADILHYAERDASAIRILQLYKHPIQGNFDYEHLKNIHKYIFQDIYEWAGMERTVDIAKSNTFCNVRFLSEQAESIFGKIRDENFLRELSKKDFIDRTAFFFGEINALHPFREGNGRTQREYFRELALSAGYRIDFSKVTEEEMITVSIDSFLCDYDKLRAMLNRITDREAIK
jgi:cell filamentation protein